MESGRRRYGALPSQSLRELMRCGFIFGADPERVSPASLDLTLSEEIYEIEGAVQMRPGEKVRDVLGIAKSEKRSITQPLQKQHTYLVRLNETLKLPEGVYGYCNPKSSTGRIYLPVRVLADGVSRFDTVAPAGFAGELWLLMSPRSFPIQVDQGESLTQLRLFNGDSRFSEFDLQLALREYKLMWHGSRNEPYEYKDLHISDHDGSLILRSGFDDKIPGYECLEPDLVLETARIGEYQTSDFFRPIEIVDDRVHLKKDKFYILTTKERIRIPPCLASEMVPMDERFGDFRSHYAGFLDPGWGWGSMGEGFGRPFTLEVRPFEDIYMRTKQPIAKIRFEYMLEEPDMQYDTRDSNYLSQSGPKLAKQFI